MGPAVQDDLFFRVVTDKPECRIMHIIAIAGDAPFKQLDRDLDLDLFFGGFILYIYSINGK